MTEIQEREVTILRYTAHVNGTKTLGAPYQNLRISQDDTEHEDRKLLSSRGPHPQFRSRSIEKVRGVIKAGIDDFYP
jgi:hypothetical protein